SAAPPHSRKYALSDPEIRTAQGISLQSPIVAKAGDIYRRGVITNISRDEREIFRSASAVTANDDDVVDDAGDWLQAIQPAAPTPMFERPGGRLPSAHHLDVAGDAEADRR